jgi:hypothetical protein
MPSENSVAAQMLNERNARFWLEQSQLRHRRLSDPALAEVAVRRVHSEAATGVPIRWHASLDQALAEAETDKEIILRELARKAGRARQADALQQLIREIVKDDPKITEPRLIHLLQGERGAGVITSIDGPNKGLAGVRHIHWVDDKERKKATSVSCLKDRLYRAKKGALTS